MVAYARRRSDARGACGAGAYIAAMGKDNNRSIALYRWSTQPGKKAEDMRIGMDKVAPQQP